MRSIVLRVVPSPLLGHDSPTLSAQDVPVSLLRGKLKSFEEGNPVRGVGSQVLSQELGHSIFRFHKIFQIKLITRSTLLTINIHISNT